MLGFVEDFLKPDGVLLLWFVSSHAGGLVAGDLLREMWILNNGCGRYLCFLQQKMKILNVRFEFLCIST